MDPNAPRRGRRPKALNNPALPEAQPIAQADSPAEPVLLGRRRRKSVGGFSMKLSAPARPGFVRRWFNDDGNRIAEADELAYDHVTDPRVQSTSSDTRISRLVGTKANGEPLRAFLMETPRDEYEAGLAEKEAKPRQIDEAIAAGRDSTGQAIAPQGETYGHGSIDRR